LIPTGHARAIAQATGAQVEGARRQGGGDIAQASLLTLSDGRCLFYKTARGAMFPAEARGLRELALPGCIGVPAVVAVADDFLALEAISTGRRGPGFFADFGRRLASLHRHSAPHFGFDGDNFIGATPQPNPKLPAGPGVWASWFWEHRLEHQLRLAEGRGRAGRSLIRAMATLEGRVPGLLEGTDEPPSLLHGDLWGGNFLVDEQGAPVLIDPAVYYGHREADLGMTLLFGGFAPGFYDAYDQEWPLPHGWRERVPLYQLYHLLNHLNLFGGGYGHQAEAAARSCLR
jgi:protein-ribulosamine 3-kinase